MWWRRDDKTLPVSIELSFQEIVSNRLAQTRCLETNAGGARLAAAELQNPRAYPQIMGYPSRLSLGRHHD
jgi:hypothetical protein